MSCLRVESKPARYSINKALSKEVATTTGTTLSQILHGFNQRSSRNLSSHSQPACTSFAGSLSVSKLGEEAEEGERGNGTLDDIVNGRCELPLSNVASGTVGTVVGDRRRRAGINRTWQSETLA